MTRVGASWDTQRVILRERISRLIPDVLTEYPYEFLVGAVALVLGLPFLLGATAPVSLLGLVGSVAFHVWAGALVLGGITVLAGLYLPAIPSTLTLILAAGLQLTGGAFGVYAIAAITVLGLAGWTSFAAYGLLSVLSFVRCHHFRRIADIQRGATQILQKGDR